MKRQRPWRLRISGWVSGLTIDSWCAAARMTRTDPEAGRRAITLIADPHLDPDLLAAKQALRAAMIARRAGHDAASCGEALAAHILRDCPPPGGAVVSAFWPLGEEIDLRPLMHALHARGHAIVLPVTPKRGNPLTFRRWRPGDVMQTERFGTLRPTGEEMTPDFLLVPLLAFDAAGGRLGYGAGYYDRTLAGLAGAFRLGCAYAAQQVDEVPMGPYDIRLHAVATERAILGCGD